MPAWMLMGGGTPSFAATSHILHTPKVVSLDRPQCRTCTHKSNNLLKKLISSGDGNGRVGSKV